MVRLVTPVVSVNDEFVMVAGGVALHFSTGWVVEGGGSGIRVMFWVPVPHPHKKAALMSKHRGKHLNMNKRSLYFYVH
jgi:hypothetical protein